MLFKCGTDGHHENPHLEHKVTLQGLKVGDNPLYINLVVVTRNWHVTTSLDTRQWTLNTKPNIKDLMCIRGKNRDLNLMEEIGLKSWDFGIQLLNDEDGNYMNSLVKQFRSDFKLISSTVLTEWINGRKNAKPHTWWSLTETLRDIGLQKMAREIEETLLDN